MACYTARLTLINDESVQPDGSSRWFDTLAVFNEDDEQVDAVNVESCEDEQPYREALSDMGWTVVGNSITGDWNVRRALGAPTRLAG